jgi:hypothetical protein
MFCVKPRTGWKPVLLALLLAPLAVQAQSYSIDWFIIDGGGGGTSVGGEYSVSGTIGQPDAGTMTNGYYTLVGGFWGVVLARREPPPVLRIRRSGDALIISWPNPSTGFQLQQSSSLAPLIQWTDVNQTPVRVDGERQVTIANPVGARFYRLRKP